MVDANSIGRPNTGDCYLNSGRKTLQQEVLSGQRLAMEIGHCISHKKLKKPLTESRKDDLYMISYKKQTRIITLPEAMKYFELKDSNKYIEEKNRKDFLKKVTEKGSFKKVVSKRVRTYEVRIIESRSYTKSRDTSLDTKPGRKSYKNSNSKFKGVCYSKNKKRFLSQIGFDGKCIHIGAYESEIAAAKAYDRKFIELYGTYEGTNESFGYYESED